MSPLDDLAFFRQLAQSDSLTVTARELGVSLPQAHPSEDKGICRVSGNGHARPSTGAARGGLIGVTPAKETIRFPVAISP